jgi:two-component sensor histidine kinase
MALVHERLNDRGEADRIDFREYASTLAHDLMFAYGAAGGAVRMRLDLHSVTLDLNRAIPCGLILNELITNSLKYAFPDGRRGEIRVSLSAGADGLVTMEVADDGVGLPAGFDWRSSTSLGLRIVDILSRQIDGAVAVGGASGASFVLKFPQAPERRQEAVAGGGGS